MAVIYLVRSTSGGLELNLTFDVNCYFPSERYSTKDQQGKWKKLGLDFGKRNTYRLNSSYNRSDALSEASRPRLEESRCWGTFGFPSGFGRTGRRGRAQEMKRHAGTFSTKERRKKRKNQRVAVSESIQNLQRVKLLAGDVFIHRRQRGEREAGKVPKLMSHKPNVRFEAGRWSCLRVRAAQLIVFFKAILVLTVQQSHFKTYQGTSVTQANSCFKENTSVHGKN